MLLQRGPNKLSPSCVGLFWLRCWKSDSTRFTQHTASRHRQTNSTESTAVVVVVLQLHFSSFPVPWAIIVICKEKKNLHAAQSTGIYWAGLYRSPSQKMPRNEKAAKKENGKEKAKEKKKKVQISPEGVSSLFLFLYTLLRIPLYIRFSLPSIWGLETRHQPFKWRESQKRDYIDRTMGVSQRREWKRIWKIYAWL